VKDRSKEGEKGGGGKDDTEKKRKADKGISKIE
jgi:hypothetical protein